MKFTVLIETCDADGLAWEALQPAWQVDKRNPGWTAGHVAREVANQQTVAEDDAWRVRAWEGVDADTSREPDAEVYHHQR